jgi:hypothetical protein
MSRETINMVTDSDEIDFVIDQPLVSVEIMNLRTGLRAKGHSKCDPTDRWNKELGTQLAYVRALGRVARKVERYYIKLSANNARS